MTASSIRRVRFENCGPRYFVGLRIRCTQTTGQDIPQLWQRFAAHMGRIPQQRTDEYFGLVLPGSTPDSIDYLAAAEVSEPNTPSSGELQEVTIAAQRFAVFEHRDHVSQLRRTIDRIFRDWLPHSGHSVPAAAVMIERYGPSFDLTTGTGGMEIWIAVNA